MASRQKFHCPICGTVARSLEIRTNLDGSRRRRLECTRIGCKHRWTPPNEPPAQPLPPRSRLKPRKPRAASDPLTDDEIQQILTILDLSTARMGQRLGRSREIVRQVRLGLSHADRLPHIPRWSSEQSRQRTCDQCDQWLGHCTLGHPDPEDEGLEFARECIDFLPRTPVKLKRASADSSPAESADSGPPAAA
jgi:hypothetical protein